MSDSPDWGSVEEIIGHLDFMLYETACLCGGLVEPYPWKIECEDCADNAIAYCMREAFEFGRRQYKREVMEANRIV